MDGWFQMFPPNLTRIVTPSRIAAIAIVATSAGSVGWLVRERHDAGRVHVLTDARLPTSDLALMEAAFNRAKLVDYVVEEGRILVPKAKQSDYVRALVDAGALPKEFGGSLRRALERNSPWQSRATQAELLRVATQEELSLVLCSMPGIRRASVLVDTQEAMIGRGAGDKTASVSIETEHEESLEAERVRAIRVLVAASIAGLPAERVAVTDLRTGRVFTGPLTDAEHRSPGDQPAPDARTAVAGPDVAPPPTRRPSVALLPRQPSASAEANAPAELGEPPRPDATIDTPSPTKVDEEKGPNQGPRRNDAAARVHSLSPRLAACMLWATVVPGIRRRRSLLGGICLALGVVWANTAIVLADPPLAAVNATAEVGTDVASIGTQPGLGTGAPGLEPGSKGIPPDATSTIGTDKTTESKDGGLQQIVDLFFSGRSGGASITAALVFGVASLAPAVLLMATCFVRMSVVLSLLRQGLGAGGIPSNQIVTSLALFLTALVMWPVWRNCWAEGVEPLAEGRIQLSQALDRGSRPLRAWMRSQIDATGNQETLAYFATIGSRADDGAASTVPSVIGMDGSGAGDTLDVLLPAFLVSELKTAFSIGLKLLIPFLAIDVVAGVVVATAGLPTLSPSTVSLPLKLLVFVVADGWTLVVRALVGGYLPA